jgi:hypothetical protein
MIRWGRAAPNSPMAAKAFALPPSNLRTTGVGEPCMSYCRRPMKAGDSVRVRSYIALLILLTAVTPHAISAPAPGDSAATLPDVLSVGDLLKQPAVSIGGDWVVRVGMSDGGSDAGPWILLYCLASYTGAGQPTQLPLLSDLDLGPLEVKVFWDGKLVERSVPTHRRAAARAVQHLYCVCIPSPGHGASRLEVADSNGRLLFRRELPPVERSLNYFQDLVGVEHDKRPTGMIRARYRVWPISKPAMPNYAGTRDLLAVAAIPPIDPAKHLLGENLLPGVLPQVPEWRSHLGAGANEVPALGLSLANGLLILESKPGKIRDWPEECLLARWWVNGKPTMASPPSALLHKEPYSAPLSNRIEIAFGLPESLGELKVGDKIEMRVYYFPDGTTPWLFAPLVQPVAPLDDGIDAVALPMASNRIDFTVTQAMLDTRMK